MKLISQITLAGVLITASASLIAADKPEISFRSTKVAEGLFMLQGEGGFAGGNLGLSVGKDGVVLIDDSMPQFLGVMNDAIKKHTQKDIDFVINTHVHGDHLGNNEAMGKAGSHIVAHENLRRQLTEKGFNGKPMVKEAMPVITFSHTMSFHLNDTHAELIHAPSAHTDGDALVHFTNLNVIHAGDTLFNGMFPFIDLSSGGSIDGYIKAQEKIVSLSNEQTKIIAGHGPLASRADVEASITMLKDCRNIIAGLVKAGKSEEDVIKLNPLAKYHDKYNWGFITTERMTRQLYQGLSSN